MIRALTTEDMKNLVEDRATAGFGSIETPSGCLPLVALDVDTLIEGMAAATTVRQQFRNVFNEPLEATYIFPLPPRGAVTGFRMTVNGEVIEGRIDERGKAREDYDAAIAEGCTASIAEQERSDVFTVRVGNIPPKSTADIELVLVAPVAIDCLEATYRFPLVVAPRYCPGVPLDGEQAGDGIGSDTDLVPDASRISPPVLLPGQKSPVKLAIRVRIAAAMLDATNGSESTSVACTLPVKDDRGGDGGLIVSVVPEQRLDRDFILRWTIATGPVVSATLLLEPDSTRANGLGSGRPAEEAPGDGTFELVVVPPALSTDIERPPRDVVFLLDRSGSMGGWKIVAARRAVARMVDTLSADDRVAVLAFDDSVEHPGKSVELAPATDRHRWKSIEWLGGIDARGGTQLAAGIRAALAAFQQSGSAAPQPTTAGRRERTIVIVTDCQVGDEDRVVAKLAKEIGDARLFVVGIDAAVNEGLLSRMVNSTGGIAEMVESEDRLDEVMDRIQRRLAAPLVADLAIESAGLEIVAESIVPAKLPDLVPGMPVVVRGRYRDSPSGGVRVVGTRPSGERWQEKVEPTTSSTGCQGNLWARGRLRDLEDRYAGSLDTIDPQSLENRMVELSIAFGVLCRFTAVVAIDPRRPDRKLPAEVRRIVQPVETAYRLFCPPMPSHCLPVVDHVTPSVFLSRSYGRGTSATPSFAQATPEHILRLQARDILTKARPKSGAVADVTAARIKSLLKAVVAVIDQMKQAQPDDELIERLTAAHDRVKAFPADRDALVALLDVLADIADHMAPAARWWVKSELTP